MRKLGLDCVGIGYIPGPSIVKRGLVKLIFGSIILVIPPGPQKHLRLHMTGMFGAPGSVFTGPPCTMYLKFGGSGTKPAAGTALGTLVAGEADSSIKHISTPLFNEQFTDAYGWPLVLQEKSLH
jgi:hypothetical protein